MKFSEPQKLRDGRYFVKTKTDDDKSVFVQLNKVKLLTPFAEGDSVTIGTGMSFDSYDSEIVKAAVENGSSWFGREIKDTTVKAAYTPSVTQSETMNVNKFKNIRAFDADRQPIDPNDLGADAECDCVIELVGLWFMKKTFGPHWRLVQVRKRKQPRKNVYESYLFEDDQEEEEDVEDDEECL